MTEVTPPMYGHWMRRMLAKRLPLALCFLVVTGCAAEAPEPRLKAATKTGIDKVPSRLAASGVTKETLNVGKATAVQSDSPFGRYQAVFEDDGTTGYFYALDSEKTGNPIVDAMGIYNVDSVADRAAPSELHIVWSVDGAKVALFINSYPHALFNFTEGVGCCRTGSPPLAKGEATLEWDESQMEHFYSKESD